MLAPDLDGHARPAWVDVAQLAGAALALYVVLAWTLDAPGGWTLRRWIEPARERRAREVALHASERMQAWRDENERAPAGSVVFLGSSTIERMPLAALFPGQRVLNRGIARATELELVRWLDRILPRAAPAAFVVYAGSIDWREDGASAPEVVERTRALLDALAARAPAAPIALVGVLSERGAPPERVARLVELDDALAAHCRARNPPAAFVPTLRPPLCTPETSSSAGPLAEDLSSDSLHLNEEGYRVLARWILDDGGAAGRLLSP
ncbi:MAG: hypothetical protein IPJ77_04365 [Planctomycetes bacterium]|nr:hypothetical protein [Planctomycetota bacterium]